MTKLLEWLAAIGAFLAVYFSIIFGFVLTDVYDKYPIAIQLAPIGLVLCFGIYAACTVMYRVCTFNDCPEASKEIQSQIEEARKDLISKGFRFRD